MIVTLIEKKKAGKASQREMPCHQELAEKILRKSKGWEIKEGQDVEFKNGALLVKQAKEEKPLKKQKSSD